MSDMNEFEINKADYEIKFENVENNSTTKVSDAEPEKVETAVVETNADLNNAKTKKQEKVITPAKNVLLMNLQRLGVILNNISLFAGIALLVCFFAIMLFPVAYIVNFFVIIIISVFTLGLIYLECSFDDLMIIDNDFVVNAVQFLGNALPYIFGALIITSLASLILLLLDKRNIDKTRVAISASILGIVVVGFIIVIVGIIIGGAK